MDSLLVENQAAVYFFMKIYRHVSILGIFPDFVLCGLGILSHSHLNYLFLPSILISINKLFSISIKSFSGKFLNSLVKDLSLRSSGNVLVLWLGDKVKIFLW